MSFRLHHRSSKKRRSPSRISDYVKPVPFFVFIIVIISISFKFKQPSTPLKTKLKQLAEEQVENKCPATRHRPLYIFSHLHKTGGNTLKRILFTFAKKNNISLYHTCHPVIPESPFSFTAWWLQRALKTAASKSLDCNLDELRLNHINAQNKSSIQMVVGHQHHGVHALFPHRDARYFTFMRHPLYRKASHFFHFEQGHPDHENASLVEYLLSKNSNYMMKRLATQVPMSELAHYIRERAIDIDPFAARGALTSAETHLLRDFFFVGLHHRYAESVCILFHIFARACRYGQSPQPNEFGSSRTSKWSSWKQSTLMSQFAPKMKAVERMKDNVRGRAATAIKVLPEGVRERVLAVERHDMHLFKLAESLFEDRLSQYEQCRGVTSSSELNIQL